MEATEFTKILDSLTAKQRQILHRFLAGQSDQSIATDLYVEVSTVRRHLANLCKAFGFTNAEGEHYSHRPALVALCLLHRPAWVSPALIDGPTLPEPGRSIGLASTFYLERPLIESRVVQEIQKPGSLVRIRAARQLGKTSLMQRMLAQAEQAGYQTVYLSLRQAEGLHDLDALLRWFCGNLSHRLGLPHQIESYWDQARFGSITSCTIYLQAAVLTQCSTALVLGLDDVDSLFEFPQVAAGFFALLRSWYEEANSLEIWQKLRLIVAHSTEVYIPLKLNQSPFNVGLPVRLPNLTIAQIDQLALRYRLRWTTEASAKLHALTGGHPYLVQLALYHLADAQLQGDPLTLAELLQLAPTQSGIYASHLRHHWQMLRVDPDLLEALTQLLEGAACLEPSIAYRLEGSGLIRLEGNLAHISCELYRQFFRSFVHLTRG